ncbi:hypothetical protein BDZ45DRAFT_596161 [Acephala macrosclerotiorum]|nr:hypothetical protein BDZ45DRAFT_596161 [Acephala macrosclerotiorum]
MERPSGPLGAATQSSRPMVDNGMPRAAPLNTARRIPNAVRHAQSSSSLSKQKSLSAAEVIALAREAMKVAVDEHAEVVKAEGLNVPGVTIDLSHKLIQIFPEEVVDIIKNELERFALSHNQISAFPSRFAECTSLRYLNIRNNLIREFPESICQLKALEILDLGRNKLKTLPDQLAQLTSLKVLSVQRNRLEILPVCIADMTPLQILKLEGNPLRFPPKELLPLQTQTSPNGGSQETNEVDDMAVTIQVKKILRQKVVNDRSETESGGEESSEGTETPRPVRRVMSGRFPIKVNGTEVPDMRSPAFPPRPPPIPSRSHYRQLSQQNAALRRPGVMPLTIGSANERLRSNSEGLLPDTRDPNRPAERSRRMGIVSKRAQELGTVDELKANNRYSHHGRGLSHGSAMSVGTNGSTRSPASPADSVLGRATYVKRLSSLPERKRESTSVDPVIEAAKSILYALFQVHPLIQSLLGVARDETKRRTSLERVFFNANSHVEDLDRHIQIYDTYTEEDEEAAPRSNENIHRTCVDCVSAYVHVCSLLQSNVQALLENGDPRYIRTLLLNVYGSIAEIRNASEAFARAREPVDGMPGMEDGRARIVLDETLRPARLNLDRAIVRSQYVTSTREQPGTAPRSRSGTTIQRPPNLQVSTDQQLPAPNGIGRSNIFTNNSNFNPSLTNGIDRATPRSGESFTSSASGSRITGDYTEEDLKWEAIFLALRGSVELTLRNMPIVKDHFTAAMQLSDQRDRPQVPTAAWQKLIAKGDEWINAAAFLKNRLSQIKLNQPGVRTQPSFWQSCAKFVEVYTDFILDVKKIKQQSSLFPNQVVDLIRPLQKEIKATSAQIFNSPWANLAHANNGQLNGSTQSPASQVPLPMTPQSAALGPAVQATVPSTPGSATFVNMPSYYGQSQAGQRSNTMTYGVANFSMSNSRENTMTLASGGPWLGPSDGTRAPPFEQSRRGRGRGILEAGFDTRPNAPLTPLPVMNEAQQRAIAQDNERRKRERGANGDRTGNDNGDNSGGSGGGSGEPTI